MDGVRKQPEEKQKIFHMAVNVAGLHMDALDNLFDRIALIEEETPAQTWIRKGISVAVLLVTFWLNLPAQIVLKKLKISSAGGSTMQFRAPALFQDILPISFVLSIFLLWTPTG